MHEFFYLSRFMPVLNLYKSSDNYRRRRHHHHLIICAASARHYYFLLLTVLWLKHAIQCILSVLFLFVASVLLFISFSFYANVYIKQ